MNSTAEKKIVTMNDIALEIGVSRATVSLVLNKRDRDLRISDETRRSVTEAAQRLEYRPNDLARAVVTGKNHVMGFVTDYMGYEPVARILSGAMEEADHHQYLIKTLRLKEGKFAQETVESCIRQRLAGVIVCSLHEYVDHEPMREEVRLELAKYGVHVVIAASNMFAYSDDCAGFRLAIRHLKELGHRRIAMMSGLPNAAICVAREHEWRAAMEEENMDMSEGSVLYGGWRADTGLEALRQLQGRPERPTALCCVTDRAAMQVLNAAWKIALRVPDELSVIGYGGLTMTDLSTPRLTTVAQPFEEMGKLSVRRLLLTGGSDHAGKEEEDQVSVPRLSVRESTAIPPVT